MNETKPSLIAASVKPDCSPRRVQLRRTKGWRTPDNTVVVSRPTRWGNPFCVVRGSVMQSSKLTVVKRYEQWLTGNNVLSSAQNEANKPTIEEIRRELGGKNLACWCSEGDACHADVLLCLANPDISEGIQY